MPAAPQHLPLHPVASGYIYAVKDRDVYVNLFMSNTADLDVAGKKLVLSQSTRYPWNGDVNIKVDKNNAGKFTMKIRIPDGFATKWFRATSTPTPTENASATP